MYTVEQICDRLEIDKETLNNGLSLIKDDEECNCDPSFFGGKTYYRAEIVGWLLQLSSELKSDQVKDFKGKPVDLHAITRLMEGKEETTVKSVKEEEVKTSKVVRMRPQSNLIENNFALMPQQNAIASPSPLELKAKHVEERFKLQKLVQEAIEKKLQLSTQDIKDLCDRNPKAKVGEIWTYGRYEFTKFARNLWTVDFK